MLLRKVEATKELNELMGATLTTKRSEWDSRRESTNPLNITLFLDWIGRMLSFAQTPPLTDSFNASITFLLLAMLINTARISC